MSFYEDMAQLASDMVTEYGRSMLLRSYIVTGTDYEPIKTAIDTAITGVFTTFNTSDIDGTLIKSEDKICIVDANIVPDKSNSIVDSGFVYEIINVMEIKPAEVGILYKLHVRK